ncbi:MAG: hypothetical protein JNL88_03765 [Bacteroidia bacterium]|nr:hypothetical protein [Bacteroidia bacterium]
MPYLWSVRCLRHPGTFLFLLLSLQVIIPVQLWHGLCEHNDTVDCLHEFGETSVSDHHEHCLILDLTLPPLYQHEEDAGILPCSTDFFFSTFLHLPPLWRTAGLSGTRAPPVDFS